MRIELGSSRTELDGSRTELKCTRDQLASLETTIITLRADAVDSKSKHDAMSTISSELRHQVTDLHQEIDSLRDDNERANSQLVKQLKANQESSDSLIRTMEENGELAKQVRSQRELWKTNRDLKRALESSNDRFQLITSHLKGEKWRSRRRDDAVEGLREHWAASGQEAAARLLWD